MDLAQLIALFGKLKELGPAGGITWALVFAARWLRESGWNGTGFLKKVLPDQALLPFGAACAMGAVTMLNGGHPPVDATNSAAAAWMIAVLGQNASKQIAEAARGGK